MGRETAIQKIKWNDNGWLDLEAGGNEPQVVVEYSGICEHKWIENPSLDHFDELELSIDFQTLRVPLGEENLSLKARLGFLRLKGGESISSLFKQSLVARRQKHFNFSAHTYMEFQPDTFQQMAGLIYLYDNENFFYLRIFKKIDNETYIGILTCDKGEFCKWEQHDIKIKKTNGYRLKIEVCERQMQFNYCNNFINANAWEKIGPKFDITRLSDEYIGNRFTGAFIGLCCHDMSGNKKHADFDYFEYINTGEKDNA